MIRRKHALIIMYFAGMAMIAVWAAKDARGFIGIVGASIVAFVIFSVFVNE